MAGIIRISPNNRMILSQCLQKGQIVEFIGSDLLEFSIRGGERGKTLQGKRREQGDTSLREESGNLKSQ